MEKNIPPPPRRSKDEECRAPWGTLAVAGWNNPNPLRSGMFL